MAITLLFSPEKKAKRGSILTSFIPTSSYLARRSGTSRFGGVAYAKNTPWRGDEA